MYSLGPSFLGLFTKSSHNIDVTAAMVLVGVVAGISILMATFGLPPFLVLALVLAEFTKFIPFFSSAVITSSVCDGVSDPVGLTQYSLAVSTQHQKKKKRECYYVSNCVARIIQKCYHIRDGFTVNA